MSAVELARVLTEAGELELLTDWMDGELWELYEESGRVLVDPAATREERDRARLVRERLDRMYVEIRALYDAGG